jgi:integrase
MKHSIRFFPEKRKDKNGQLISENVPISADIRFSGQKISYFTGYRINVDWQNPDKSKWNFTTHRVRKNSSAFEGKNIVQYNEVNTRLTAIEDALNKLFEGTPDKNQIIARLDEVTKKADVPEVEQVKEVDFFKMFEQYAKEPRFSAGRKRHILSVKEKWKKFDKRMTFNTFTADTLKKFEKHLLSDKKHPRGVNTAHAIIKLTRAFWNYCRRDLRDKGISLHYPFENYSIPAEVYTKPIYITKEERDTLYAFEPELESLKRVRDIFVFQCLIGARVGDLCKLTKDNISDGILSYIPRKTKDDKPVVVSVPLSTKALEILSRYNLPGGRLLPFISDQKYNDYLKELFEAAKLTRMVTRLNPTTRKEERVRICDIASSHMARRAFIGNLYGKVDSGIISSMSGHVQGSKAFTRYYDVSSDLQKEAIKLID